jgi:acyl-CoA synthetase (NDP forming)
MSVIDRLVRPRSVAIVGASADPKSLTGRPVAYLQAHGFGGDIYPINPRYPTVAGLTSYPDATSLPRPPDVGIVLVGANRVIDAVRQLSLAGTSAAIVLASGFGEAGEEGVRRQRALRDAAGPMRILGPNTIGLVNLADGIMLSPSGALALPEFPVGKIALISQSGGILGSLLSRAVGRGIGFSALVATGNESDLEAADFIDFFADDDATSVISLYLETIRNFEAFRSASKKAAAHGKPIVVHKVGRSEVGAQCTVSHTGALAGADRIYDAFFRQNGIIRAETFSDLLDIPATLSTGRVLRGKRIAIVTSTGGAATMVADCIGMAGFEVPMPDSDTAKQLVSLDIPEAVLDRNPIDVTLAGLRPDIFQRVIRTLLESTSYDAAVVVVGSSSIGQPDVVAGPLVESLAIGHKPLLAYVSPDAPAIVKHLNRMGVPAFAAPESCAPLLSALLRNVTPHANVDQPVTPSVALDAFADGPLNETESKRLFARSGIRVTRENQVATPAQAQAAAYELGSAVVLKILSREILHKSEVGGVRVNVAVDDVQQSCQDMAARVARLSVGRVEGFLVQELVTGGVEMILGFRRDPQLGPFILLGLGGVATEVYQDTAIRLLPFDRSDAERMVDELKAAVLLKGFRGRPRADIAALVDAIMSFAAMASSAGDRLSEAEINPLFVFPEGQGVCAADGLVVLNGGIGGRQLRPQPVVELL